MRFYRDLIFTFIAYRTLFWIGGCDIFVRSKVNAAAIGVGLLLALVTIGLKRQWIKDFSNE